MGTPPTRTPVVKGEIRLERYDFSGPLPPPEALAAYERVFPGAAERIIRMAEEQGQHRRNLETITVKSNAFAQRLGPVLGFIVAMTAIIGGVLLSMKGMSGAGLTSIISALAALVGVFVYGKRSQKRELQEKVQALRRAEETGTQPANINHA